MPQVSIVILTFNSSGFVKSCLGSVFGQDYQSFEVILVDNGSTDDTVFLAKEHYPEVRLIENKENLGACKARNQGIEMAVGEWVLTLDCDVVLEKNFLSKIIILAKNATEPIAMLQPKILNEDKETIYSCGIYLSILRRFFDIGKGKKDFEQFDKNKNIFGVCSAAAFYKRKALEEIKGKNGVFDNRFFFLVEDVDLSWRLQKKGYRALFVPEAKCFHFGNSSKTAKKIRQYLCFRNRYLMIEKNESFLGKIKLFIIGFWYDIPRFICLFLIKKLVIKYK